MREDADWDSDFVKESLTIIEEESDRLNLLIENLLDATRLQAGGVSLKKSEVDIPAVAKRLATRFQTQTDKHKLTVDFPDNFPSVFADESRIEQIISNLISNSIKYAGKGEICISGETRKKNVVVSVSDEGEGIAPQDMPYIFDRFYRSSDAMRTKKGAGLGLYLAKSIVDAHNGNIWFETDYKKGAKICFSLPYGNEE